VSLLVDSILSLFALVGVAVVIGDLCADNPTLIALTDGDLHPEEGDV
jgi:hypothetical protein